MMIRVARLLVARQRAVGEDGMFRVVQHHFILRRELQIRINRQAGFHVFMADGRHSLVPVISIHGIFTAPNALAALPVSASWD